MADPAAIRVRRARARRPSTVQPPWRSLLLVLGLGATAALAIVLYREHVASHVAISFTAGDGRPVPPLELTFFPDRLAFTAPSPPSPLGERQLDGAAVLVDRTLVPERALLRYRGPGVGAGFVFVELGTDPPPIRLAAPASLRGRVVEPVPMWCFGWRHGGVRPVAGADVLLMGGGEHGVDLAVARTDADGRFELHGFDGTLDALGLRVRAAGFAALDRPLVALERSADDGVTIALQRTVVRRGVVVAPPAVDPSTLRVLARGVPGVEAVPAADGSFVMDHLPQDVEARLILHGLPPTFTWLDARTDQRAIVRVDVVPGAAVRGRVFDAITLEPLPGAFVHCGDRPAVRTDDDGRYALERLLPGECELQAQHRPEGRAGARRPPERFGVRRVTLEAGAVHEGLDILVRRTP